mmetsp:Transcript_32734/g.92845  ORF Transcript_32734/g.92845 Transcript_32734/m.92845 type:complete len:644 (-) Transcript_32734:207-2138(-)
MPPAGTASPAVILKAKVHSEMHAITPASVLEPEPAPPTVFPGTKVCVTLGPSCQETSILVELLNAGMTAARVDLTWGNVEFHKKSLRNLVEACRLTKRLCAIMVDTLGREIYVKRVFELDASGWPVSREVLKFVKGDRIILTTEEGSEATSEVLPVTYSGFPDMCQSGDEIFIGRYLSTGAESSSCYARVIEVTATDVICELESNAEMTGLLTIFHVERSKSDVVNKQNQLPILVESDIQSLKELKGEFEIDWLNLSYTKSSRDVLEARQILDSLGLQGTKIMAKPETRQSLLEFRNILKVADGIVMSRGNLGIDVLPEKMCLVQKAFISACNVVGKPVMITRVVDTMATTPRPTRAEATDVANAVLDGVDGILLGAETLRGLYPVETVRTIVSIAYQAEKSFDYQTHFEFLMSESMDESEVSELGLSAEMGGMGLLPSGSDSTFQSQANLAGMGHGSFSKGSLTDLPGSHGIPTMRPMMSKLESICSSAVRCADKIQAKMILVFTNSGRTARLLAKYRPPMPILTMVIPCLANDGLSWKLVGRSTARQCQVVRGLCPVLASPFPTGTDILREALQTASDMGMVGMSDLVVCVQKLQDDISLKTVAVADVMEIPAVEYNQLSTGSVVAGRGSTEINKLGFHMP